MADAFCAICERFPGYRFEHLAEENDVQILAKLHYIERNPAPVTRLVG